MDKHTPGPWAHRNGRIFAADNENLTIANVARAFDGDYSPANGDVLATAPELIDLVKEARAAMTAYLEDHQHNAPHDCYATGPKTGDEFHDLVRCPGCCAEKAFSSLVGKVDAALAKARGDAVRDLDDFVECQACYGKGFNDVERQVAERKSDVQTFRETCDACEGTGKVSAGGAA